jgi:hypothetical protein
MIQIPSPPPPALELDSFARLMRQLGETFALRDVVVQLSDLVYVAPGDIDRARAVVAEKRYSVVPASRDGKHFTTVFCTKHPLNGTRTLTKTTKDLKARLRELEAPQEVWDSILAVEGEVRFPLDR